MFFLLQARKISWLNIYTVLILSMTSGTDSYRPFPVTLKPPEIWVSSYEEVDEYKNTLVEPEFRSLDQFENEFISKFNKTDYVITEDINIIYFSCQASYPVKWSIPYMKHIERQRFYIFETSTSRLSNFDQGLNSVPVNESYQAVIKIQLTSLVDIFSVNLTCGRADDALEIGNIKNTNQVELFSSIHLFYAGSYAIENEGSTIQVHIASRKKKYYTPTVILPCRPATPTVLILLEKQMENQNKPKENWKRLNYPTEYLSFDPKVGFIVDKNNMRHISIFGLYKCTALEEWDDINEMGNGEDNTQRPFVYVNVTFNDDPEIDYEAIEFQPTIELKGDAMIAYNHEVFGKPNNVSLNLSSEEFICCSGIQNKSPSIYSEYCIGYLQCDILKWLMAAKLQVNVLIDFMNYMANNIIDDTMNGSNGCLKTQFFISPVKFCVGENVKFANHFVNVFSNGLIPISNRSENKINGILEFSTLEPETRNFELSQKMFLTVGHPLTLMESDEGDSVNNFAVFFMGNDGSLDFEYDDQIDLSEDLKQKELRRIAEYSRDHFYVGESLIPICLGWTSFYSYGAYVVINFRNGTKQVLNSKKKFLETEVHFSDVSSNSLFYYNNAQQIVHKFGLEMCASKDMVSMECWMPQWNTKKWDTLARDIKIVDAVPPRFVDSRDLKEEKIIYVYLGEEDKELVWNVDRGAPEAKIEVTKDGRGILRRSIDLGDENRMEDDKPRDTVFNVTLEKDNGTMAVVRIRFVGKVTHEMEGVYQCKVENIGGDVRRSYRVIVAGKVNAWIYVLLVPMILSSVLLIGLGFRNWQQRRQVWFLRNNQT